MTQHKPLMNLCVILLLTLSGCGSKSSPLKHLFSIQFDSSMPRNDIVLIFPGLNQSSSSPGYGTIGDYYKHKGITPVFVNIDWKLVGVNKLSCAALAIDTMLKDSFPDSHLFLFGFSFGAAIALKLSQLEKTEQVVLCSMSPVFSEDRSYQVFPFKQIIGLIADYSKNGLSYSNNLGKCVFFLYGTHDNFLINKAIIQNRRLSFKCNETILVDSAHHNISGRTYLAEIDKIVQGISR
jgi:hypothetical protein